MPEKNGQTILGITRKRALKKSKNPESSLEVCDIVLEGFSETSRKYIDRICKNSYTKIAIYT